MMLKVLVGKHIKSIYYILSTFIKPKNKWTHTYISHKIEDGFIVGKYNIQTTHLGVKFKGTRKVAFCYGSEWKIVIKDSDNIYIVTKKVINYKGDKQCSKYQKMEQSQLKA